MALLYIDGFDHYAVATGAGNKIQERAPGLWDGGGTQQDNHQVCDTMPVLGGRGLAQRFRPQASGTGVTIHTALRLPRARQDGETWGFGFHLYMNALNTSDTHMLMMLCTGLSVSNIDISLCTTSGGNIHVRRGSSGGSLLGTSSGALMAGVLYHIEMKIFHHAVNGTIEIRVNGSTFLLITDVDTSVTNALDLGIGGTQGTSGSNGNRYFVDNLYVWDDQGGEVTDWVGEKFVDTLFPDQDLSPQDWSLSTGSDAFDLLNNVPADDAQYVEAGVVGDTSVFGMTPFDHADVVAIQTVVRADKSGTDPASVSVQPVGGAGGVHPLTQDQPLRFIDVWELNPATSLPWDASEINNLQIELERVA